MSTPRILALMGSGETAPTMVEVHKRLLERARGDGAPDARLLDTPYGFQENAPQVTASALHYFAHNVGREVEPLSVTGDASPVRQEAALAAAAEADWLFAGPGSPSYLLRKWRPTRMRDVLADKLATGGVVVFASAAACVLGGHAVPVYEIYKAGFDPFWLEGLDLMAEIGLEAVVIPHFDNAEGGTHDTRYCYLGETRLTAMEDQLPGDTWVLGVDEHTAAILDLDADTLRVDGRGGVTVRVDGRAEVFGDGTEVPLTVLRRAARRPAPEAAEGAGDPEPPTAADRGEPRRRARRRGTSPLMAAVADHRSAFDEAMAAGEPMAAVEAALGLEETLRGWATDTLESDEMDRAGGELRQMITRLGRLADAGLHDHRDVVAPPVRALLDLRSSARGRGDYATADWIRDRLVDAGVEVRDTPDGVRWEYHGPPAGG